MKKVQKLGILALSLLIGTGAMAGRDYRRICRFLPENNLHLQDNKAMHSLTSLDETEFNNRIDQMEKLYKPIFEGHGASFSVERLWDDTTVNAYADESGNDWVVHMFGGLARRPEVTPDGFSLVICHETGHHLGGYPFYTGDWAAAEGQADYFATQACAKLLWADDKAENAKSRGHAAATATAKCNATYTSTDDQNLCYRTANASQSLANLLAALGSEAVPSFDTPDSTVIRKTSSAHPAGQCRLDTYFAGAICSKEFKRDYIPGRAGTNQTGSGANTKAAEQDSDKYTCGGVASSGPGIRPACWFKSLAHTAARR